MIRILEIGAHNDEIMWDMGGVANILQKKGCEQLFLGLACQWNDSLPDSEKERYRAQEEAAANILGGKFLSIGNREDILFTESKEAIDKAARIIIDYDPHIIFLHWPKDNHAEHRAAAQVAYKAFCAAHVRGANIGEVYAFEGSGKQTSDYFSPDFFADVGEELPTVRRSLLCFDQNFANGQALADEYDQHRLFRGMSAGCKYAEAFKIIKFPNGSDDILLKKLLDNKFRWKGNGHYPTFGKYFFE